MKELTLKQKMFIKSNMTCSICGKVIDRTEDFEVTKTKRGNYITVHKRCI